MSTRRIEVNSDKYTVGGVLFGLALVLIAFVSDLHDLVWHRSAVRQVGSWTYLSAVFIVWVVVSICRNSKIRKAYPYGVVGGCLMAISFLMMIALSWLKAGNDTQLLHSLLIILEIVAYGLILMEAVRWFRSVVKIAERRAE